LVFTQFNRVGDPPDNLRPLPSKNIDTGMGLERTAAVIQGVDTNYHIDILRPLVETAADVCGIKYEPDSENGRRLRRVADHVRACAFAVHENVYPGPNKEKYVVKRLLRRAVLDGRQIGVREPFLHKLVGKVAELMAVPYPELGETVKRVSQVIEGEEANFLGTIDGGLDRIHRIFEQMKKQNRGMVSGAEAAEMYQTYGFPPELFETMAAEHNLTFDWDGYQAEMDQHGITSGGGQKIELFKHDPLEALKKAMHGSQFLGYNSLQVEGAKVIGIIAGGKLCDKADDTDPERPITVVLDKTPFYGEMGGQVGDRGELVADGLRFDVTDAHVDGHFTLHLGHLREGELQLGTLLTARVDGDRRRGIQRAHSATHLLHHALRKLLGQHAEQQGSKVDQDILRFDFTNPKAVGRDELTRIEQEVNARILEGDAVEAVDMPLADARKSGATMLFGEKYPDVVRVVSMGGYSKELCGGTHLTNTGQVGLFWIVGEESVSAGTRRITALTGVAALERVRRDETLLRELSTALKVPADELPHRVEVMAEEIRRLKKQQATGGAKAEQTDVAGLIAGAESMGDAKLIVQEIAGATPEALRDLIDKIRRKTAPVAVMLATRQEEGKVLLVAGLSRDLVGQGADAVKWVRQVAKLVQGGGGGRPDMAQAGGKNAEKLPEALATARGELEACLVS
ncbi:MAG TPA: alanine--tRNA ligase, partial [Planctomycetaceae bacterium]|nr:alanine--tRNA ligase [Planctomycetaceae bacterium]